MHECPSGIAPAIGREMAVKRLTKQIVDDLASRGTDYVVWCGKLPGFGCRVRPSGHKSFVVMYRAGGRNAIPRQALNMQCPAERYAPSTRPYRGLPELDYPFHDRTLTVTTCGRICFNRKKINLSVVFAGQNVGIKQVSDRIWLVTFMDYDLGYFDDETCRLEPLDSPFGPKVLPMSPV